MNAAMCRTDTFLLLEHMLLFMKMFSVVILPEHF